ncbi:hypothetical protein FRX31_019866 [Thalictrum thalictroides]|uniref:Reverse transcriptase zinc-binding domain-containing protein n=1 Tax=Thalictrum thalictroides TaxID=46969 RepID=A0A7J6W220_THATH|nr:hypothetical protein FRX31_019866 [Thalictrum thalictroides]
MFPRLFALSTHKEGSVFEFSIAQNIRDRWQFNFRRQILEREQPLVESLKQCVEDYHISTDNDGWAWKWDKGGVFTVRSMYKVINHEVTMTGQPRPASFPCDLVWQLKIPLKTKLFFWGLMLGRTQTVENLNRIGMQLDVRCKLCGGGLESILHLFFHCSFAAAVWEETMHPLGNAQPDPRLASGVQEWLRNWPVATPTPLGEKIWKLTPYAVIWTIWKKRNEWIFRGRTCSVQRVCMEVRWYLWYWMAGSVLRRNHHFNELIQGWAFHITGG